MSRAAAGPSSEPGTEGGSHLLARWWRRRTLRARLALLVTGAVAVAVLTLAALALPPSPRSSSIRPSHSWPPTRKPSPRSPASGGTASGGPTGDHPDPDHDHDGPHDLGPRWQILGPTGAVVSQSASPLPVTPQRSQVAAGEAGRSQEQVSIGGESYLMLTVPARGGGAVQVAIDQGPDQRPWPSSGCCWPPAVSSASPAPPCSAALSPAPGWFRCSTSRRRSKRSRSRWISTSPSRCNGADEIARLGRSVNTMLAAIDTARRDQRTLVEDAGHELRTPLTSIRTNIELLLAVERHPELAHRLPPEERAKLLSDLDAQVRELATLTTELVELAREETTREQTEPVELTDVIDAAIDRARTRAPSLTFTTDLRQVTVHGRPSELERMILNVLDNAAKWSPPGATVHTVLRVDGPEWCRADASPTPDPASTMPTSPMSSTASTGRRPHGPCPDPASGWPSSPRPRPSTAARSRPRRTRHTER